VQRINHNAARLALGKNDFSMGGIDPLYLNPTALSPLNGGRKLITHAPAVKLIEIRLEPIARFRQFTGL
jgi:hypothetical protein